MFLLNALSFHSTKMKEREITLDEIKGELAQQRVRAVQKETERCYLSSKDILDNFREVDYDNHMALLIMLDWIYDPIHRLRQI